MSHTSKIEAETRDQHVGNPLADLPSQKAAIALYSLCFLASLEAHTAGAAMVSAVQEARGSNCGQLARRTGSAESVAVAVSSLRANHALGERE